MIRHRAADLLEDEIAKLRGEGAELAPPDAALIGVVKEVARHGDHDRNAYVLTKTWQAASDAIRAHMDAYVSADPEQTLRGCEHRIRRYYLPRS